MTEFPKYSEINQFYKHKNILDEEVIITEKLHGTNARVMYCPEEEKIITGGRNMVFDGPKSKGDGFGFYQWIQDRDFGELENYQGCVFYGEFYGDGINNGGHYTKDVKKDFRVFDIRHPDGTFFSWDEVVMACLDTRFKAVPLLNRGKFTEEELQSLINIPSEAARENGVPSDNIAEGIVIKPVVPRSDRYGHRLIVKLKAKAWAEQTPGAKASKAFNPETAKKEQAAKDFAELNITNGRIATIVDHITRDGNTTIDMCRTPDFLRELNKDIWKDHPELEASLDKGTKKIFNKEIGHKARPLWKEYVEENYNA